MPVEGDYDSLSEARIKHLELIQAAIGRLGNDSFLVKGWAVTVVGIFVGFAVDKTDGALALVSVLPALFFWALDTRFLRDERLFRVLYDHIRCSTGGIEPFFMAATSRTFTDRLEPGSQRDAGSFRKAFMSPALGGFYGALIVASLGVALAICRG